MDGSGIFEKPSCGVAADGSPAEAVLAGHPWLPGKVQASGWQGRQTGVDRRRKGGPQVGMGGLGDADPSQGGPGAPCRGS